jgi:hypothetical protein
MNDRRSRILTWLGWIVPALIFIAIFLYLIFGQPDAFDMRLEIVILAFALIGIPLGIKYGSQDKFWT